MINITDKDRDRIKELIEFAEDNVSTYEDLIDRSNNPDKAVGLNEKHNCIIDGGYRIVYSVEEQSFGKCKHISITYNDDLPSIPDAEIIMKEFGMNSDLRASHIYQEKIDGGHAINFIQPILDN